MNERDLDSPERTLDRAAGRDPALSNALDKASPEKSRDGMEKDVTANLSLDKSGPEKGAEKDKGMEFEVGGQQNKPKSVVDEMMNSIDKSIKNTMGQAADFISPNPRKRDEGMER